VECGGSLCVARHRPFHLVSAGDARAVRGELPAARKIPRGARHECARVVARPVSVESRAEFQADLHSARTNELRDLLAATIHLQSRFLAERMEAALPKMLAAAPAGQRENIRAQFARLAATGAGTFALIDYVNFKGGGDQARGALPGRRLGPAPGARRHERQRQRRTRGVWPQRRCCARAPCAKLPARTRRSALARGLEKAACIATGSDGP